MQKIAFYTFMALFLLVIDSPVFSQDEIELQDEISYPLLERLLTTARANYPTLKTYDARIGIAEKGVKQTRLSYFDIFSFSYLFSPFGGQAAINPNQLNGYQFGFFANIGSLLQKPTQVRQARDQLRVVELERDAYLLNLDAEVRQRYFQYVKAKASYRIIAKSVLDAQSLVEDAKYRFERGEIPFETYSRTLSERSIRQQGKVAMEGDILIAKSRLEELLGKRLEDIR
ncbi:TolC family protein [Persicitalea sp.]|uniref:TolC family protein n=1 Tax=Persicitalea sp. TaxID=3100273 RepID=UPI0035940C82